MKPTRPNHESRLSSPPVHERREACCYCGRPGKPGDCFEGKMLDRDGACPSCGYPYRGLGRDVEEELDVIRRELAGVDGEIQRLRADGGG